tara:strand:- start:10782 stop:18041 length:7260 start_codon:yes stop_codon:yes gene_type:complete
MCRSFNTSQHFATGLVAFFIFSASVFAVSSNLPLVDGRLDDDRDGLPDTWESLYDLDGEGLEPDANDDAIYSGSAQTDSITNIQEYLLGTRPNISDTDADGLKDGEDPSPITTAFDFGQVRLWLRPLRGIELDSENGVNTPLDQPRYLEAWTDQSTSGIVFSQSEHGKQPFWSSDLMSGISSAGNANGLVETGAVAFDGVNDTLVSGSSPLSSADEDVVVCVVWTPSSLNDGVVWEQDGMSLSTDASGFYYFTYQGTPFLAIPYDPEPVDLETNQDIVSIVELENLGQSGSLVRLSHNGSRVHEQVIDLPSISITGVITLGESDTLTDSFYEGSITEVLVAVGGLPTEDQLDQMVSYFQETYQLHLSEPMTPESPVAVIAVGNSSINVDTVLSVSGENSTGEITSYEWDFDGDGSFDSTGVSTAYTYTTEGDYTLKLKITDVYGQTVEAERIVHVESGELADSDGDGFPNVFEVQFGSLPDGPDSHLSKPEYGHEAYFRVDGSLSEPSGNTYPDIVTAEAAADDFEYSIIEVFPGEYPGSVTLQTKIFMFGSGGTDTTFLRANTNETCALYLKDTVVIDGLTILDSPQGINVSLSSNEQVVIRNCNILNNGIGNMVSSGGGVYLYGGAIRIEDSLIQNNQASSYGGGVYVQSATVQIQNSVLKWNHSGSYGGAIYQYSGNLSLLGSLLIENFSEDSGAGVYVSTGDQNVVQSTILNNRASGNYDGIYLSSSSYVYNYINTIVWNPKETLDWSGHIKLPSGILSTDIFDHCLIPASDGRVEINNVPLSVSDPKITRDGHLKADSPAVDAGIITSVLIDIDGESFPSINVDLGVDEYVDSDTVPDQLPDWFESLYGVTESDSLAGDSDSLTNLNEYVLGTNPNETDTDGDSLTDDEEIVSGTDSRITDPLNPDDDFDGMPTIWEKGYWPELDYTVNDANDDEEPDNLTNIVEFQNGTNPLSAHSDSDIMPDAWELENGFDPLVDDGGLNADTDLLTNAEEYSEGTDPRNPDTDGDSLPDDWEVQYGLDPLDDGLYTDPYGNEQDDGVNGPYGHFDSDTATNLYEFYQGTDPSSDDNALNTPSLVALDLPVDDIVLLQGDPLDLSATATDVDLDTPIARVEFYADDERIFAVTNVSGDIYSKTWYSIPLSGEADTDYSIKVRAVDVYGHRVDSESVMLTMLADSDKDRLADTWEITYMGGLSQPANGDYDGDGSTNLYEYVNGTNPDDNTDFPANATSIIILDSPVNGAEYAEGDSITLEATASDLDTGIDRVEFHGDSLSLLATDETPERYSAYAYTWVDALAQFALIDNTVSFFARVFDDGGVAISEFPLIAEYTQNPDGTFDYGSLDFHVEIPESGAVLDRIEFYHNKNAVVTLIATLSPTESLVRYSWTWSEFSLGNLGDTYLLSAVSLDDLNNVVDSPELITQNSIDADGGENPNSLDLIVVLTATEASAVSSVEFYLQKTELIASDRIPEGNLFSWTWRDVDLSGAGGAIYSITATVIDTYGHEVTSTPASITIKGDSDHDGIPDEWEQGIIDAGITDQDGDGDVDFNDVLASADFDGDGASNYHEYIEGTSATNDSDFPPENTASVISLTAPDYGDAQIEGESLLISATATDVDTAIIQVAFYINGVQIAVDSDTSDDGFSVVWPKPSVLGGADTIYSITAKVTDVFQNVVVSSPVEYTVWADTDKDSLADSWEQAIIDAGLADQDGDTDVDIYDVLPTGDYDNDQANNYLEFLDGTNPVVADDPVTNQLSEISWAEPADETTLWQGEALELVTITTDVDTEIERVDFYYQGVGSLVFIGSSSLNVGNDRYQLTWFELPAETNGLNAYSLTATVFDVYGHEVTSPALAINVRSDVDGDRMQDDWEQTIIDAGLVTDEDGDLDVDIYDVLPASDSDGDGASNYFEYVSGTSASDPGDSPVNTPSQISMLTPVGGATYWEGDVVAISASATDLDTEISHVVFFVDGSEVGTDFSASADIFEIEWADTAVNVETESVTHSLSATVTDVYGNIVASSSVTVTILEDADGDHMQDGWERTYFGGNLNQEPDGDYDGDGALNRLEYDSGTNPNDSEDFPSDASAIISLSAPTDGATAWEGEALALEAVATDTDTEIVRVEFYEGGNLLGSDTVASANDSYSYIWSNLPAQSPSLTSYSITAKVVDSYGRVVSSAAITVYVQGDSDLDGLPDDWEQSIIDAGLTDQDGDLDVDVFDVLPSADFDSDNVTNLEEYLLGFDPVDSDSEDNDGSDDDNDDGVTDDLEDRDGDSMPDVWELRYEKWVNFEQSDGGEDPDGDGIINSLEYQYGLHPGVFNENAVDLDNDGLLDSWEQQIIAAGLTDQDGDGDVDLDDVLGSDDFDNDGILNEDEYQNGTDPTDPTNGTTDDPDGDGLGSEFERLQRTNPLKRDNPIVNLKLILPANE